MTFIAWFEIVVGAMIVALWIALLVTRQVPEFTEGRKDIWFHLAAEALTAALLVAGGIFVLVSGGQATPATIAIGASLYTAVNSAASTPTAASGQSWRCSGRWRLSRPPARSRCGSGRPDRRQTARVLAYLGVHVAVLDIASNTARRPTVPAPAHLRAGVTVPV